MDRSDLPFPMNSWFATRSVEYVLYLALPGFSRTRLSDYYATVFRITQLSNVLVRSPSLDQLQRKMGTVNIAIIGGESCGLTLVGLLECKGIVYVIYERDESESSNAGRLLI